jgi:hypothetical protein
VEEETKITRELAAKLLPIMPADIYYLYEFTVVSIALRKSKG